MPVVVFQFKSGHCLLFKCVFIERITRGNATATSAAADKSKADDDDDELICKKDRKIESKKSDED